MTADQFVLDVNFNEPLISISTNPIQSHAKQTRIERLVGRKVEASSVFAAWWGWRPGSSPPPPPPPTPRPTPPPAWKERHPYLNPWTKIDDQHKNFGRGEIEIRTARRLSSPERDRDEGKHLHLRLSLGLHPRLWAASRLPESSPPPPPPPSPPPPPLVLIEDIGRAPTTLTAKERWRDAEGGRGILSPIRLLRFGSGERIEREREGGSRVCLPKRSDSRGTWRTDSRWGAATMRPGPFPDPYSPLGAEACSVCFDYG